MMGKIHKLLRNRKGFTLIELIVVIAVLGILASIAVPKVGNITEKARQNADAHHIRILNEALERYIAESGDSDLSEIPGSSNGLNANEVINALKDENGMDGYGPYLKSNVTTALPSGDTVSFDEDTLEFE